MSITGRGLKDAVWRFVGPLRQKIIHYTRRPPVGRIDWGGLRSMTPVSRDWGFDRGTPIDRYYIEQFLSNHSSDIRGRVLEVANNTYTERYGGERVTKSDVIHPTTGNPRATIVADLTDARDVSDALFDCIICTQTLQLIFDFEAAMITMYRLLRDRGVLLLTVPGISQICREDMAISGDYWRFTDASLKRVFSRAFPGSACEIRPYGNVLSSTAFLHGIATEELQDTELAAHDPQYQLLLTARAEKSA